MIFKTLLDSILIFIGAALVVNISSDENIMFKFEAPGIVGFVVTFLFMHIMSREGGYYDQIFTQNPESKKTHAPHVQTKRSKPSYHIKTDEEEDEDKEPEFVSPYASKPAQSAAKQKKEEHSYFEQKKSEYEQQKAKQDSQKKQEQQQRNQQRQQKREEQKFTKFQLELNAALALFSMKEPYTKMEVNTRFKELMLGAHPDRGGKHDDAIKINTARDCLLKNLEDRTAKPT